MVLHVVCISAGASLGALLRWVLGRALNGMVPLLPMGTLLVNLAGAYCLGVMLGIVAFFPQFPDNARLFVITGFLGALTTFSTFSGEVVLLLQERHFLAATALVAMHLAGSFTLTGLGIATASLFVKGH